VSKLIDLPDEDNPFIQSNDIDFKKNHQEYYIDKEFFEIDSINARIYNDRVAELTKYTVYAESFMDITDPNQRMKAFAALSYAMRKAGEAEAWASYFYNSARTHRKEAESIAALDDFGDYVTKRLAENNEIKATDKNREWYIQQSPRVIRAMKREAMAEAIQKSLWIFRLQFSQALGTLKAFSYGANEASAYSALDHSK
jgi:hypothetical protein